LELLSPGGGSLLVSAGGQGGCPCRVNFCPRRAWKSPRGRDSFFAPRSRSLRWAYGLLCASAISHQFVGSYSSACSVTVVCAVSQQ